MNDLGKTLATGSPRKRRAIWRIGALILLMAAGVLAWWHFSQKGDRPPARSGHERWRGSRSFDRMKIVTLPDGEITELHVGLKGTMDKRKTKVVFGGTAKMLGTAEVEAVTGHPVGGVCPFGLASKLPVYCDVTLMRGDGSENIDHRQARGHVHAQILGFYHVDGLLARLHDVR